MGDGTKIYNILFTMIGEINNVNSMMFPMVYELSLLDGYKL